MAKFSAIVCLPPEAGADVEAAVAAALAPFKICEGPEETWMWDEWWIRDGTAGFPVIPGHDDDPRLVHRKTLWDGSPAAPPVPGWCGGAPHELIDFATPLAEAERRAEAAWRVLSELGAAHPPAASWGELRARSLADPDGYPYPQMNADYQAQPFVHALAELQGHEHVPFSQTADPFVWLDDPVLLLTGGWPAYRRKATAGIISAEALLTLDGRWLDEDGAFGYATVQACPEPGLNWRDLYRMEATDYLLSLPGDTLLIRLGCHC
ncbi:hypothetical protein [Yinghuangia seranimata]|uniref:hypothetical protein n=1 Tax=Yinghuangia seranimata TaxID=408067 RepID=UPI00248D26B0|nr:hypothetical protein [Yinghuangia seranimata]MDI2132529.1 hypothetical protein [Yinghuangia seranimata]